MKKKQTKEDQVQVPFQPVKLAIHLQSKNLPDTNQIKDHYLIAFRELLKLFVTKDESTSFILHELISVALPNKTNQIKNLQTLEQIIFQQTIKAAKKYCFPKDFKELKIEIGHLENIFSSISKMPEEHKKIILLCLQFEHINQIAEELRIEVKQASKKVNEAATHLKSIVKTRTVAWVIIKTIIVKGTNPQKKS